jgi:hypothetical protein
MKGASTAACVGAAGRGGEITGVGNGVGANATAGVVTGGGAGVDADATAAAKPMVAGAAAGATGVGIGRATDGALAAIDAAIDDGALIGSASKAV